MSRMIKVVDGDGVQDYVAAECEDVVHSSVNGPRRSLPGKVEFSLSSTGMPVNPQSASHFEDWDGVAYYVEEEQDQEWLLKL